MNVTVIPFLLGALISVKDVEEWNFGPEYVFQLNKTTILFKNRNEIEDVTAMVNCRPKVSSQNNLLCHAHRIIVSKMTPQINTNANITTIGKMFFIPRAVATQMPDQLFEIEFGRQGIQGFEVRARKNRYNSITDIIEQFHIGIDLSVAVGESMKNCENMINRSHVISSFTQYEEYTTRAFKCNTSWIIACTSSNQYNEDKEFEIQNNKTNFGFHLRLLPISYTNLAGKTFLIERNRMACSKQPHLVFFNEKWKIQNMTQYFNKMKICDKNPKFTSYTHLEGNILFPRNRLYYFSEDVHLHLLRIRPARTKFDTKLK